jgi:tetratricopeptide (TPR) repeat protein/V8-like Glu-specific endopeptidase
MLNHSISFVLSSSVIGAAATIALVQPAALALTASEIDRIAEAVTVRIDTPGSSGSGVIIQREGNIYTVLTARHVIDSIRGNEEAYVIPASDERQSYRINNSSIQALPNNVDLAIFQFQSSATYQTATLGNSDAMNRGSDSYVSGYPLLSDALNQPLRQFTAGKITANASQPLDSGYGIVYSNNTLPGMSGGPVFNSQGEVIGIHGRADTDQTQSTSNPGVVVKTGFNLAIPINTFRRWNGQTLAVSLQSEARLPETLIETTESRADSLLIRAKQQFYLSRFEAAISLYDQALAIDPNNSNAYAERGEAYLGIVTDSGQQYNNDNQRALSDFNRAIEINPNNALAYARRGYLNILEDKEAEGLRDLEQALLLEPGNAEIYMTFGDSYNYLGRYEQAIENYSKAIEVEPTIATTYTSRGSAYHGLGEYHLSITDYDRAIKLDPTSLTAYYNRGNAYNWLGESHYALADFNQAIRLNPNFALAYNGRGVSYGQLGQYRRAISDFSQAIQLDPNYPNSYANRGTSYLSLADCRSALQDFDRALAIDPNYKTARDNRNRVARILNTRQCRSR